MKQGLLVIQRYSSIFPRDIVNGSKHEIDIFGLISPEERKQLLEMRAFSLSFDLLISLKLVYTFKLFRDLRCTERKLSVSGTCS